MSAENNCHCRCGKAAFQVHGQPLMRVFCHCIICQQFNQAPFSDITVFLAKDVDLPPPSAVAYKAWRPPPSVQRGVCTDCGAPAIEILNLFPLPKLAIVPSANIHEPARLPTPALHMFYHRRVADIRDELPKYSGYWGSQLGFARQLLPALIHHKADS